MGWTWVAAGSNGKLAGKPLDSGPLMLPQLETPAQIHDEMFPGIVWACSCPTCSPSKGSRVVARIETGVGVGFDVPAGKPVLDFINAVLGIVP